MSSHTFYPPTPHPSSSPIPFPSVNILAQAWIQICSDANGGYFNNRFLKNQAVFSIITVESLVIE